MDKKKLAFYDAFRQKPDESGEPVTDSQIDNSSTSSKDLRRYTSYTPSEDLAVRAQPKQVPTSHHYVSGKNVEIRAKGATLPPGMAQKYQTPNVNRTYLSPETESFRAIPVLPQDQSVGGASTNRRVANTPPMPTGNVKEESRNYISAPVNEGVQSSKIPPIPQFPPEAKPISEQSSTLPYLDPRDLETQSFQAIDNNTRSSGKQSSAMQASLENPYLSRDNVISITVPQLLLAGMVGLVMIVFAFFIGKNLQRDNIPLEQTQKVKEVTKPRPVETSAVISDTKKVGTPVEIPKIETKEQKQPVPVEKPQNSYIIIAATLENMNQAKSVGEKLISFGYKPIDYQKYSSGNVAVIIGPFETSSEGNNVLKRLKALPIKGKRPFEKAWLKRK